MKAPAERALRTETTINDPRDFYVPKGVEHTPELRKIGQTANTKLLQTQRLAEDCLLTQAEFDAMQHTTTTTQGQRAHGLRFGDFRVMALFHALCLFLHVPTGFRNCHLR